MRRITRFKILAGQSLIEIIVAMAVMAVFGVAIVSVVIVTQKASISAINRSEATKYAQQLFEQMRASRNTNTLPNMFASSYSINNGSISGGGNFFCMTLSPNWILSQVGTVNAGSYSCPKSSPPPLATQFTGVPYYYTIWYSCYSPGTTDSNTCSSSTSTKAVLTVSIFWTEAGQQSSISETETLYSLNFSGS